MVVLGFQHMGFLTPDKEFRVFMLYLLFPFIFFILHPRNESNCYYEGRKFV